MNSVVDKIGQIDRRREQLFIIMLFIMMATKKERKAQWNWCLLFLLGFSSSIFIHFPALFKTYIFI